MLEPSASARVSSLGLRGADIVLRTLEEVGVEVCFGMPGGAILPIYDALARGTTLRHVLVRHEQGAGHMAQGYARASGRPGVVLATSGPGATNLVTPIADARMDSTPLVCLTGQVRSDLIGTDAFQECDIVEVVRPLVKGAWPVRDVADVGPTIAHAVALACAGRPGPVLVDIPRDVQEAVLGRVAGATATAGLGASPAAPGDVDVRAVTRALDELAGARRPVLYVGGGAQGCADDVRALAERAQVPVVTTLMGKGAFPERHRLFVGWPGMHGTRAANRALHDADLIIAAGARFDDRVTGRVDAFAPGARVVHIDVDAHELGKIRHADVAIHGDLGGVLRAMTARLGPVARADRKAWREELAGWQRRHPLRHAPGVAGGPLKPQDVLRIAAAATAARRDVIWTTGVGQHQMWAMQHLGVDAPRSFLTSGGLGTMGYGLPAALGAKLARPDATVVAIDGDGSFQMTLQELGTAVAAEIAVVVIILNNGQLGMVDQWQTMFYDQRRSHSDLRPGMPSFAAIARGYGAHGHDVHTEGELRDALAAALEADRATVLDVRVDPGEACFPMILPGGAAADQVEWDGRS
ncbi:MAG TPA: biosynthetic-type acetolactate synthase large subunit [Baekduia sp.]|uniref:biosynthetic-type acetolactate synthase large subunit n=1 Tax=Baekduia sp. TaxID=2600305 RepID=UPI002D78F93A|nr:biosynthetic-type acetolactate synthase large subunit [Baekduia sp.]HET6509671.1 biosynthetic-type acetolactate synthase large subunit [Baekduia sp.]